MAILRYGADSLLKLELAEGVLADESETPRGRPLQDPRAAARAALEQPLDYPPLARCTTPADRVVLALDYAVPQAAEMVAAAIDALVTAGVDPDGLRVLRTQADADAGQDDPCRLLAGALRERVKLLTHDPANRKQLAYLAASETGEPILLSRALHDADLVLPIGCVRDEAAAGYFGIHSPIFPTYSDWKTQSRFRGISSSNGQRDYQGKLVAEVDHVAWLLGIQFTVQLVPAAGDGILHVLAGQSDAVRRGSRELYHAAWSRPVPRRASLIVAAIEGGAAQQTWENLGRALSAASSVVEDGGAIAVCCDLAAEPGPAVQRMLSAHSRQQALRWIHKDRPADALPAAQLANAMERSTVYLLSRLDPGLVEGLDIIPVADGEELTRLARHHGSCILLSNAPSTMPVVQGEG